MCGIKLSKIKVLHKIDTRIPGQSHYTHPLEVCDVDLYRLRKMKCTHYTLRRQLHGEQHQEPGGQPQLFELEVRVSSLEERRGASCLLWQQTQLSQQNLCLPM